VIVGTAALGFVELTITIFPIDPRGERFSRGGRREKEKEKEKGKEKN